MNLILTDEQRQALSTASNQELVTVFDPGTNVSYVLLRTEQYQQCRALLSAEPFDVREAYAAMDEVAGREGWLDPEMDAYDQLDPRTP